MGVVGLETTAWFWYFKLLLAGNLSYLLFASKRAYQLTWISTLWRFPILFIALALAHGAFRFVQFFITGSLVEI
jgi:hypothetical protein